jgi:hypothetical protein
MVALRPSRRAILGTLTAACAASAVGAYLWTIGADALIGKILSRRLPGVRIDTVSIASLSRDVQAAFFKTLARRASLKGGALATRTVGIDALAHFKLTATEFSSGSRLTFESRRGFQADWTHASLAHANRNLHHSQAR